MASIAALVYFTSSAYEVSGGCATDTVYPSFSRILATASQPEPSANAPCTRTTFLMPVCGAAAATFGVFSSSRVAPISVAATVAITYSFFMTAWQNSMRGLPCVELFISNLLDQALSRIAEGTASQDGVIGGPHFEGRRRLDVDQPSFDGDRYGM